MKLFLTVASAMFACTVAFAQNSSPNVNIIKRGISFKFINKDSVNLPLNDKYDLIEDSCSTIIMYTHLNMLQHKFTGELKAVSRLNPQLVVAEGNYTADGLKNGAFISRYLNGNVQTKGNFKANMFDGRWELYYDDGKPKLTFEANGNDIKIFDSWDEKGNKIIDNGKGNYRVDLDGLYWKGKLVDGKPDGTWKGIKADDATQPVLISEVYKNGAFQKGKGPLGDYTDAARLTLVAPQQIPFIEAELLHPSLTACDGINNFKKIVNAQYSNGFNTFSQYIKDAVEPFLRTVDFKTYDSELLLEGEVNETGKISNLIARTTFDANITRGLIRQLYTLPYLQPATVDGKPVAQKLNITFNFNRGVYSFNYKLLPIKAK